MTEVLTRFDDSNSPAAPYFDLAVQHPLIDTNGDGLGSNEIVSIDGADGLPMQGFFLGAGPSYDVTNSVDNPVDISSISPTRHLPDGVNTVHFLQLTTTNDDDVQAAWVEVRAPNTALMTQTGTIQVNPDLDRQSLQSRATCLASFEIDAWCTPYNLLGQQASVAAGKYEVFYFVQDVGSPAQGIEGKISPAQRSLVYRNHDTNNNPSAPLLVAPVDRGANPTATTDTQLLFDWDASIDPDGDPISYTLEISTDDTFATVDFRQEEILAPIFTWMAVGG